MSRWCPLGLTRSQKCKLQRISAKESKEKEAEKIFNDTHLQYPREWKPKAAETTQATTKIEDKTAVVQLSAGMADRPAPAARPFEPSTDYPTPESILYAPTPMGDNEL
jgi:hypothetical protein